MGQLFRAKWRWFFCFTGLPAYLGFYPGFGGDRHGFFDYSLTMPNFAPSSSNLFASGSSGVASSRRTEDVNETDASREGALSNRNSGAFGVFPSMPAEAFPSTPGFSDCAEFERPTQLFVTQVFQTANKAVDSIPPAHHHHILQAIRWLIHILPKCCLHSPRWSAPLTHWTCPLWPVLSPRIPSTFKTSPCKTTCTKMPVQPLLTLVRCRPITPARTVHPPYLIRPHVRRVPRPLLIWLTLMFLQNPTVQVPSRILRSLGYVPGF